MRSVMIHGVRDIRIQEDAAKPSPATGEALIRVLTVGVCGSDVHYYQEGGIGSARVGSGMVPGHEFAGEVLEGGGFAPGTVDAIDPAQPCGKCEQCQAGHPNLCLQIRFLGTPGINGGLCDFIAVPAANVIPLPAELDSTRGALLEPLGVALHAVDISHIKPLNGVAVLGAGPIGLLVAQVARVAGASLVRVIEPHDGRRETARKLGFEVHTDLEEALRATDGHGEPYVIEATNSPVGFEHAAQMASVGGRVTLVGIPQGNLQTIDASNARRKGLTVKFSRRMGNVYPRAIELVASGRVNVDILASHRYPLEKAPEAFAAADELRPDFIKAMIYPA